MMGVDLVTLYLNIHNQCCLSPDGVYQCDAARFYKDTGYTTFNVLASLVKNGALKVKAVGKDQPDSLYQITLGKQA